MSEYAPKMTAANGAASPSRMFTFKNEHGRSTWWSPDQLIAAAQYVIGVQATTDENGHVLRDNQRPEIAALLDALDSAGAYTRRIPALAGLEDEAELRRLLDGKALYVMGREHFDNQQKPLYEIKFGMVMGDKVVFSETNGAYIAPPTP